MAGVIRVDVRCRMKELSDYVTMGSYVLHKGHQWHNVEYVRQDVFISGALSVTVNFSSANRTGTVGC
jgi:hypothetical protein